MEVKHSITGWLIQWTQRTPKHAIGPLEIYLRVIVIAVEGAWVVEVVGGSPARRPLDVVNEDSVSPHVHHINEPAITLAVSYVDDNVGVQRPLKHLIGWELIRQNLLIRVKVESDNFRGAKLLQIRQSVDDTGINDKQPATLIDRHSVDRQKSRAVWVRR